MNAPITAGEKPRAYALSRRTKETEVSADLCLDGGEVDIKTGIGFFDHMLTALAFYAGWGLTLTARGDLEVDGHHTVEDTGIVLGQAFAAALGNKKGIKRYGTAFVPMDEALCLTALEKAVAPGMKVLDLGCGSGILSIAALLLGAASA